MAIFTRVFEAIKLTLPREAAETYPSVSLRALLHSAAGIQLEPISAIYTHQNKYRSKKVEGVRS